jgi:DNA-directed RNA polymerase II subunit RPB1
VALRALATRDWIDWTTTITNDVVATAEVLGMVAARAVLFAELDKVVSAEGGYVDARHIAQLVTTMTHRGFVMALSRHGINRTDYSVLQRASFEEPVDNLQAAAAAGTVDPGTLVTTHLTLSEGADHLMRMDEFPGTGMAVITDLSR